MSKNYSPMITIAHIQVKDRDYCVHISMNTETHCMHVFKYNGIACDYDVFENQWEVTEFLDRPLGSKPRLK
jgi:hypothetical protein